MLLARLTIAALPLLLCMNIMGQTQAPAPGQASPPRDVRYVVLHSPGPAWQPGKSLFEQQGVREHVEHYRQLLAQGKLLLGGPHLDAKGGGMMIPTAAATEAEIKQFANEDPAVKSGLLLVEVRPWLIGMIKP